MSQLRPKGEKVGQIAAGWSFNFPSPRERVSRSTGCAESCKNSSGRRFARNCAPRRRERDGERILRITAPRYEDVHAFVHKLRGGKPMPYLPPLMSAISFKLTHIFSP